MRNSQLGVRSQEFRKPINVVDREGFGLDCMLFVCEDSACSPHRMITKHCIAFKALALRNYSLKGMVLLRCENKVILKNRKVTMFH